MILWFVLAALAVLALVLVLMPLLRGRAGTAERADYDIEVYLDQLGELDRDAARGIIGTEEAAAARTEIERRMLAANRAREAVTPRAPSRWPRLVAAILLAVAIPAAALALYSRLGSPGLPGQPFAERPATQESDLAARAAARLEEAEAGVRANPASAGAWHSLGRMRFLVRQWDGAADALAEAARLAPGRGDFASAWGEALVYGTDGQVTARARAVFAKALAVSPDEPRARYYLALAELQAGHETEALKAFAALLRETPPDAPWRPQVEARSRALATKLGEDFETLLSASAAPKSKSPPPEPKPPEPKPQRTEPQRPETRQASPPRGPGAEDLAAAQEMPPEDRATMIRGMVERLAARLETEPGDVEGWRKLGRSWSVLGENRKASDAYGRALALEPGHPETLFRAALAASDAGDKAAALERFTRLRTLIPPNTDAYIAVNRAIERLDSGTPAPR